MEVLAGTTIVKAGTTVRRQRLLSGAGDVIAKSGQEVSPMQVVARMPRNVLFHVLNASEILGVTPEQLKERLVVNEGEDVSAGMVLAAKRGFFGKNLVSPIDGTLHRVRKGRVILRRSADWTELRALMTGRVVRRISDRGVMLEADGSLIQAVWGSNKEGLGELKLLSNAADEELSIGMLNESVRGYVVAVASIDSLDVLRRAAELNVLGLIAGSMTGELCQASSSLPFPVIITDGVGHGCMAQPIFDLLRESEGRQVSLFGKSDDAFPPVRPEIIFAHSAAPKFDPLPANEPISIGQTVRICRSPYSSKIGEVVRIHAHAQQTSIGSKAPGANIRLQDGHVVFVPFNNLDVLIT